MNRRFAQRRSSVEKAPTNASHASTRRRGQIRRRVDAYDACPGGLLGREPPHRCPCQIIVPPYRISIFNASACFSTVFTASSCKSGG